MDDDDKPFACTASGCGMRFTNEDHLTVHKKKHEMSLNLTTAIKNNTNLFVDQTPTPTRFIRNCEEVGLFQDLNPFDQQFHKAIEISKSGGSMSHETLQVPSDSDTLNTPAVLDSDLVVSTTTCTSDDVPTTNRSGSSNIQVLTSALQPSSTTTDSDDDDVIVISSCVPADTTESPLLVTNSQTNTIPQPITTNQIIHLSTNETSLVNTPITETQGAHVVAGTAATVVQLLLKLPDGRSVPVQIPTIPMVQTTNMQPTMATSNVTSLAKMKLKQSLIQNNQNTSPNSNNMNVMTEAVDMVMNQEQMSDSMDSLKFVEIINKRRRTSEEDPDEKRRRFLERNRAAATRCRLKRKQFIQNLERRADELSGTNVQLQNEVSSLRNEVAQLKTMLLAHKDCPVTLQQKGLVESSDLLGDHSSQNVTTIGITSAEAIATTALTTMAHAHSVPTHPEHILPVDIVIESDPNELEQQFGSG